MLGDILNILFSGNLDLTHPDVVSLKDSITDKLGEIKELRSFFVSDLRNEIEMFSELERLSR